jgi:uncharacterized protein (TIGR02996 family)
VAGTLWQERLALTRTKGTAMPPSKGTSRPEEAGFLQDILAHPDDDAPRLVYADWLDDHGEETRAEFIRLQIELAQLEEWDARRPGLEQRQKRLLKLHARPWGEGMVRKVYGGEFRRGFLERIELPPNVFLANADELFRRFPLRRLRLGSSFGDPAVRALAISPHLARLTELEIPYSRMTAAGLEALVSSPHVRGLKVLEIDFNRIGAEGARLIAEAPNLAGLTALTVKTCEIGSAGAAALAGSPHLAGLTKLDLMSNDIDDAGAVTLAGSPHLRDLVELSLWVNDIGPAGARALASARWPRLSRLYLSCNKLGLEGVQALTSARGLRRLTVLGLGVVCLRSAKADRVAVAQALADSPHVAGLKSLHLFRDHVGDAGARALAGSPHLAGLADLDLYENDITDEGSQALLGSPHLAGLQRINLTSNAVNPKQRALWRKRLGKNAVM